MVVEEQTVYEGISSGGSHKPNMAVSQEYYNRQEGIKRLATETGAGEWGFSRRTGKALAHLEAASAA